MKEKGLHVLTSVFLSGTLQHAQVGVGLVVRTTHRHELPGAWADIGRDGFNLKIIIFIIDMNISYGWRSFPKNIAFFCGNLISLHAFSEIVIIINVTIIADGAELNQIKGY